MDPKKMGDFIAALRKSKGLTQKEVAERLNISNKTVSKWERGDGYPEVSLIPAIAELFGVTTDEIFKGERVPEHKADLDRNPASVEKQKEWLIKSSVTKFKNYSLAALGVVIVSLVLLYGITYPAYNPELAVSVTYSLNAVAVIFQLIVGNNLAGSIRASEIFADDDPRVVQAYRALYRFSSVVFVSVITAAVLALPLTLFH
ncbi:MAG: helix-turn-helix domain-containing protein [Firmicutes bacterium]|jgi:transcriptional regulator with XRE-family HTH domain|nr:helix-turn-helix domain-containing protein [Bacillota bacterium]NLL89319.1 helix-turn-helix domain-containing protein [Bacillota bacterium]HKM17438.1 helix-turn-helix domain-containing protein [Limnochordia bacterium]